MSELLPGVPGRDEPPGGNEVGPRFAGAPRPLQVAAAVVVAQVVAEIVYVARRDELTVALRVALALVVAGQLVFADAAARRRAGGALGLFAAEGAAVLAAVGNTEWSGVARGGLAASALAVVVLVSASLGAFPSALPPPKP
jgi:hypothetical protein